jgi:ribonuclease HI
MGTLGSWASVVLIAPSGLLTKYVARLEFKATNNIAEYEGLILGLNKAKALGAKTILAKTDSQVVAGQVEKEYVTREPELAKYLATVRALKRRFQGFTLKYIPRAENTEADELAKATPNNMPIREGTFYQVLQALATQTIVKAFKTILVTESEDWRQLITDYLKNIHHSEDEASTTRIAARARSYTLMDGILYKKRASPAIAQVHNLERRQGAPLRNPFRVVWLLYWSKGIVCKGIRLGFYWSTHIKDTEQIVKACEACQTTSTHQSKPSAAVQLIPPTLPLQRWGMDLVGPLPPSQGEQIHSH